MAEFSDETALDDPGAGAGDESQQTDLDEGGQAGASEGTQADTLQDRDGAGPEDPNDPQYKYWQGAFSRTRQHDRERYGKLESEHQQFGEVLRNFYNDDAYALQVLRQRFPQIANQITLSNGTPGPMAGTTRAGSGESLATQLLQDSLGEDLTFLAPRLGPPIERVVDAMVQARLAPFQQQIQQREEQARKSTTDKLMAQLDGQHPGWEARHGKDMRELDAFLGSDQVEHPRFGNRYEILHRVVNPDINRVDAVRSMQNAGRNRLSTGRSGRQSTPDPTEAIVKARTNSEAFRLAAEAAMRDLGQS
jgi:hypothetical protein